MSKVGGLGKGFDSLIPKDLTEASLRPVVSSDQGVAEVEVVKIAPNPHQPRRHFDATELASLSDSIKNHGILQPLVVSPKGSNYELIAGERRLRAAKLAGLKVVPVVVRSLEEQQKLELALVENLQRQDLNPIETAAAYRKLMDEFNLSTEAAAKSVGKKSTTFINVVRLLGLPEAAQKALISGQISEGHARAVLAVKDPKTQQELLNQIIKNGWTVRQAELFSRESKVQSSAQRPTGPASGQTNKLTQALGQKLQTEVTLEPRAQGGRLVIRYKDDKDLERIIGRIQ